MHRKRSRIGEAPISATSFEAPAGSGHARSGIYTGLCPTATRGLFAVQPLLFLQNDCIASLRPGRTEKAAAGVDCLNERHYPGAVSRINAPPLQSRTPPIRHSVCNS